MGEWSVTLTNENGGCGDGTSSDGCNGQANGQQLNRRPHLPYEFFPFPSPASDLRVLFLMCSLFSLFSAFAAIVLV